MITSQQEEIVHFSSEGVTPSTITLPDLTDLSTNYLDMTVREDRIHTIKDFLSRPVVLTTGTWKSTDVAETQLYTVNFPEALISNTMYREKLKGFVGLRATLVVKVQVNSQPFQQGRLMLQYFPYAQYMKNRVDIVNSTLQGRSGCPRTDLDLSVGTEIEMRIPYTAPHVYYNLITGQGSFGSIYLVVYSQLRDQASGTGDVEYTVWAHLEGVDVQYPTGANIYTGNAPNLASIGSKINSGQCTDIEMEHIFRTKAYKRKTDKIFAQVASEIKQLKEDGTVSNGIGQISEGLSTMSKIPILGNAFTRPAWISSQASNIFKMLGFSKPTVQGLPCESKLRGQVRMANFDGADTSHKLALSSANEIETKSGLAGTSADEMDLSHVLSIPNYWDSFTWKTTDATNAVLWDNFVTPVKIKPYSTAITDRYRCTHMGYIANAHGYWRGSIVYTFKFVKTQFHSGRLRISFIPFYYNTTISTGTPDISATQKIIVDLRTSTEVSFTVPYVSSRPWMYCIRPESTWLGQNNFLMYNAVTGIVRVEVLNQLVAASSVYQEIDTLVEVSGGPDLTFAAPTCPSYVPYSGTFTVTPQNQPMDISDDEFEIIEEPPRKKCRIDTLDEEFEAIDEPPNKKCRIQAQIMGENEAIQRNDAQHGVYPMAIDTHNIDANWSPEAHCIGEKIMSVRQLIKRFSFVTTLTLSNTQPAIVIAPFSVKYPPTSVAPTREYSLFEYYYFLYAFWRGSMRIKATTFVSDPRTNKLTVPTGASCSWNVGIVSSIQDTFNSLVSRFLVNGDPITLTSSLTSPMVNMGSSQVEVPPNIEGNVEFEVPYYNVSHISPATLYSDIEKPIEVSNVLKGNIPPVIATFTTRSINKFPAIANATEQTNAVFYRAPGDDFSFMYLVGVPPLVNVSRT
nr:MAG: putative capsid polyprotein [Cripavirus sp.]